MIPSGKQVSIEYKLTLDDGSVADTNVGRQPLVYEQGKGQILPAIEDVVADLEVGETRQMTLSPDEGYGPVDPAAFQDVAPDAVPEEGRKPGAVLVARDANGHENRVRVREVHPDRVVLDFNHPLAGERLHFEVKLLGVQG